MVSQRLYEWRQLPQLPLQRAVEHDIVVHTYLRCGKRMHNRVTSIAHDNMFGVPPECFDTYKKCNASWNTAKRGVRVQAKGQGGMRATSANNKNYLLQIDAFHVPELASNLLSVYYLCNRGYKVVHVLPTSEVRTCR